MKIILDIPKISTDEVIDRYMRGLKPYISKELCTVNCNSLTTLMSHALSVEASKSSFSKTFTRSNLEQRPVPMDILNTRLRRIGQRRINYDKDTCIICHEKGCHSSVCPQKKKINNLEVENQENESSQ